MSHKRLRLYSISLFCWLFATCAFAFNLTYPQQLEYLVQQKNDLTVSIHETSQSLKKLPDLKEVNQALVQMQAKRVVVQGKITAFQSQLEYQKAQQQYVSEKIKTLQKASLHLEPSREVEGTLNQLQSSYLLGKKKIDLLENTIELASRYETLLIQQTARFKLVLAKAQHAEVMKRIQDERTRLTQALEVLFQTAIQLQHVNAIKQTPMEEMQHQRALLLNTQSIDLIQSKLILLEVSQKCVDADLMLQEEDNMKGLEEVNEAYREGISALASQEESLKKQYHLLMSQEKYFMDSDFKAQFSVLAKAIQDQMQEISIQEQTLQEDLENHESALNKQLSMRTHLPDWRSSGWLTIFKQLAFIPFQLYFYLKNLTLRVYENYLWQDFSTVLTMWLSIAGLCLGGLLAHWILKKNISETVSTRLTGRVYRGILILIRSNLPLFVLLAAFWVLFTVNEVTYSTYALLFNLWGVFLTFRIFNSIAKLTFIEKQADVEVSEHDWHLYHQIQFLLVLGGVSVALMIFGRQYPLSIFMQDVFDRLFMFFLLVVSIAIWRSKRTLTEQIAPILKTKKRYVRSVVSLLLILVPVTLFTTAVIGLAGYQNLAWSLSRYQADFLLLVALYVLVRGLMIDALEMISEWMISSLYNGWLWIEVFLKPLDRILRIALFMGFIVVFLELIDTYSNLSLIKQTWALLDYVLVNVSGIHMTVYSVIACIILIFVFLWLAKWTREFCYRWLYRQTRDIGMRNSMAVFTQYGVVIIGFFITFRVLGFDFTGLSLVLGGLAVGMGFGLRDFANNIVGGLMLLIERPVKEGDIISLGTFEGRVSHIGIRSMRVSSWDNMEVLIPNAETFNKPFTNWTHQDGVIRTQVPIKVSREDDPVLVQQLIIDVIAQIPEILSDPKSQVFLIQIDETLMQFEARYFININLYTRFEVLSKLLFAITAKFKEMGIRAPIPSLHVDVQQDDK